MRSFFYIKKTKIRVQAYEAFQVIYHGDSHSGSAAVPGIRFGHTITSASKKKYGNCIASRHYLVIHYMQCTRGSSAKTLSINYQTAKNSNEPDPLTIHQSIKQTILQ